MRPLTSPRIILLYSSDMPSLKHLESVNARRKSMIARLVTASIAALVLTLSGCSLTPSRAVVVGNYELRGIKAGRITLSLRDDGTFREEIGWPSNRKDHVSGFWWLRGGDVDLSGLWIPKEFAPGYIIEADERTSPPMPKYTNPGNWSLSAEKKWGGVFLSVFEDVEFKKFSGT